MTLYRGDLLAGIERRARSRGRRGCGTSASGCASRPWRAWPGCSRTSARRASSRPRSGPRSQLLALDPLQEPVHRTLMRLHAQLGQRGAALRQYQQCVNVAAARARRGAGGGDPAALPGDPPAADDRRPVSARPGAPAAAERRPRARKAPETRPAETPLIGRDAEMAQLRDALDRRLGGQRRAHRHRRRGGDRQEPSGGGADRPRGAARRTSPPRPGVRERPDPSVRSGGGRAPDRSGRP